MKHLASRTKFHTSLKAPENKINFVLNFLKITFLSIFLISSFTSQTYGQLQAYENQRPLGKPIYEAFKKATFLFETKYVPGLAGTNYINKDWETADVVFIWDSLMVKDLLIRTDVATNVVEIRLGNEVKILNSDQMLNYTLTRNGETFISNVTLNVDEPDGIFKLLYNKKSAILCHYSTKIKEANYNIAMDIGNKNDQIVVVENYYAYINKKLFALAKTRKRMIEQFESNKQIATFIKKERINPKNEKDLIQFISYYDSVNQKL